MNKNIFSVLCYQDHIWSKIVISNLLKNNCIPSCIIEENSKISQKKKLFYDKLISTKKELSMDSSIKDIINTFNKKNGTNISYSSITSHNSSECKNILLNNNPDIILLANTGIIKEEIFTISKIGTFNCHPDKLPGYRGSVVFLRKILEDLPLGVTCHWVNNIVDTGNIAFYQDVDINKGDTLGDVVYKIIDTSSGLFIKLLNTENIPYVPQEITNTPCFKFPDEEIINKCITKLNNY